GRRHLRHLLDVGARGECFLRTGDQHAADAVVGIELGDRLPKFRIQSGVERVERLRTIETNDADPAARLDDDVLILHQIYSRSLSEGRAKSKSQPFSTSCAGLTRASIIFEKRWIARSSPAMTTE